VTDAELIEFASEFRDGILDGTPSDMMCAAVSWPLAALLRGGGVSCESVETKDVETDYGSVNHVWIRLADGRVLDPTADQFSTAARPYPPVYLGQPTELHGLAQVGRNAKRQAAQRLGPKDEHAVGCEDSRCAQPNPESTP
jgi:hypothetical protein